MMKTTLSPEKLAALHAQGMAMVGPFVNPATIHHCKTILRQRGEEWAESVLLRRLNRRSMLDAAYPWLESGEEEVLVLADIAEWQEIIRQSY